MGQRVTPLEMRGFPDGLNRESDPYLLTETEVPDAINVDFGSRGEIARRQGYTRVDNPWEMGGPEQRILNWSSSDNDFLIVLGGADRKVWIGSLVDVDSWSFPTAAADENFDTMIFEGG